MSSPPSGHQAPGQFFQFQSIPHSEYDCLDSSIAPDYLTPGHEFSSNEFHTPAVYQYPESTTESLPPSPVYDGDPALTNPSFSFVGKPAMRLRSGNRVPRPRNAFMIFRSEFWAQEKISKSVERDHRHISRIIGHCWNQLPEEEKDLWRRKAELEKVEHGKRYPGYRFSPAVRTKKAVKRNVKRNGKEELLRCKQVADLLLAGKEGDELDSALMSMGSPLDEDGMALKETGNTLALSNSSLSSQMSSRALRSYNEAPIFRSPLLPPAEPPKGVSPPQYISQPPPNSSTLLASYHDQVLNSTFEENLSFQYPLHLPHPQVSPWDWDTPQPSQYPHDFSSGWASTSTSSFESSGLNYAPRADYHSNQITLPPFSAQPSSSDPHIQFIDPFSYSPHAQSPISIAQQNIPQTSIDPLHWNLS